MKKDKKLTLRLTGEAYEKVQKEADVCGMDISKYVRSRIADPASSDTLSQEQKQKIAERLCIMSNAANMASLVMGDEYPEVPEIIKEGVMYIWYILS